MHCMSVIYLETLNYVCRSVPFFCIDFAWDHSHDMKRIRFFQLFLRDFQTLKNLHTGRNIYFLGNVVREDACMRPLKVIPTEMPVLFYYCLGLLVLCNQMERPLRIKL